MSCAHQAADDSFHLRLRDALLDDEKRATRQAERDNFQQVNFDETTMMMMTQVIVSSMIASSSSFLVLLLFSQFECEYNVDCLCCCLIDCNLHIPPWATTNDADSMSLRCC